MSTPWTRAMLAATIDHTLLKATATPPQIVRLCEEAKQFGFAAVCVNPVYIPLVAGELKDSRVKTCTVIGFPLGANESRIKAEEAALAVNQGAQEVDMVINIGALKNGDRDTAETGIRRVVEAAGEAIVKVIIETCYLTAAEKVLACELSIGAGARYVKTSTGFGTGGATLEDVKLMRKTIGNAFKIKAFGGIGSMAAAVAMLEAGADRIGASAGVAIVSEIAE